MVEGKGSGRVSMTSVSGFAAYVLENDHVRLVVVPELGAKIVSLAYKPTGKEWLVSCEPRRLHCVAYGSDYAAADLSGWDECFPSILACSYPEEGAYFNAPIPDHGELWSLPWKAFASIDAIRCVVDGIVLPYTFARDVKLIDETTFRFNYEVRNTGEEPLAVFWTAHPLFVATEQTEMIFPDGVSEVLCVDGGTRLQAGLKYAWPEGESELPHPINRIGPASSADSRKFYVEGEVTHGRCGLMERDTGESIELLWSPKQLPYFGAWINEGAMISTPVVALEPCNGFYDNLVLAHALNRLIRIEPGATASWCLDIRLSCEEDSILLRRE